MSLFGGCAVQTVQQLDWTGALRAVYSSSTDADHQPPHMAADGDVGFVQKHCRSDPIVSFPD